MPVTRRTAIAGIAASSPAVTSVRGGVEPMRIGVIGAGWLGGTLGKVWVQAGHEVLFSTRHPEKLAAMARELGPRASVGTVRQAAELGPVVLVAVPYDALQGIGLELRDALRGKIVLDACNPPPGNADAEGRGVGALSSESLPGTRLVRAFSAVDATAVEASFKRQAGKLGVPLASDDAEALKVAAQLVRDAGCEPVMVGDLASARAFQRGGPGFRANTDAPDLRGRLGLPADR